MEFGCTGEQPHLSAADAFKPLRCKTDAGIAVVPSIRIIRAYLYPVYVSICTGRYRHAHLGFFRGDRQIEGAA